jgi:diaminopimelate decarboxylase
MNNEPSAPDTSSQPFFYRDGCLQVEDLPLTTLTAAATTPFYVYSQQEITHRAAAYWNSLAAITPRGQVCYAIKANGNLALLRGLAALGLGADVTSGGELFLALQAGFPPDKIVFSGVGKRREEIELALENHIQALHVESAQELEVIGKLAAAHQQKTAISLRLNPDVPAETHPYISTGGKTHKFGISADELLALAQRVASHPWLKLTGLSIHIGSQIRQLEAFAQAVQVIIHLAQTLQAQGMEISYLDVGGGLGIDYSGNEHSTLPTIAEWVQTVAEPVAAAGFGVVMEPGRSIVGPAGALITQVLYTKQQGEHQFVITDAGMTDLIRPALYQAHHPIVPLQPGAGESVFVDVVGPVCETGDTLARACQLPPVQPGDYLAILQAGAYGFAMSSNYNGRLRPSEYLVQKDQWQLIRQRQTWADLI